MTFTAWDNLLNEIQGARSRALEPSRVVLGSEVYEELKAELEKVPRGFVGPGELSGGPAMFHGLSIEVDEDNPQRCELKFVRGYV